MPFRQPILQLVAFLMVALAASPAAAATYYVSPSGNSTNPGTQGAPWSISKALGSAVAGDVISIANGAYSGELRPTNSGNAAGRISFVGNLASPSSVTFSGSINLSVRSYISVKGVQATDLSMSATTSTTRPEQDSVAYCRLTGNFNMSGALRCHVVNNIIGATTGQHRWYMGPNPIRSTLCTIRGNTMYFGGVTAQPHAIQFDRLESCEITENRVLVSMPAGAVDVHARMMYGVKNTLFRGNNWMIENKTSFQNYIFNQRDSCRFNTYVRDTVLELPSSTTPVSIRFATSGSFPGSNGWNRFFECYFKANTTIEYQNDVRGDSWFRCTLVSSGKAMDFSPLWAFADSVSFSHCTFYSSSNVALELTKTTNLRFVSNVVYSRGTYCPGVYMPATAVSDSNLFFQMTGASNKTIGHSSGACSAVGTGTSWCTSTTDDCRSRWGTPAFLDSTYASFDPSLRATSFANGAQWKDGYVGAFPFTGGATDVTPPGPVANLSVSQPGSQTLLASWTSPGDDGSSGTAMFYDLRWSNSAITSGNFDAANPVSPQPTPAVAGTAQSYVLQNLASGATFYVALRARDEAGNWSVVSNVASGTTLADTTSPAAIQNLGAATP